jgi:hypothetical protein
MRFNPKVMLAAYMAAEVKRRAPVVCASGAQVD